MSKYEDYSEVSKVYDKKRTAVGADIIAGLLHVYGGKPLKDLHVLDAGCGTGNYAKALTEHGVGKITLLDANKDMLRLAKDKLCDFIDKKIIDQVVEAELPSLPFPEGIFDVILYSQVLHHLEEIADGKNFPAMEEALKEAKRTLRPKGIMIIATVLPSTMKEAVWCSHLCDTLTEKFCKRFPTAEQYIAMFKKHGFNCVSKLNVLGVDDKTDLYTDPSGPLKEEFRKSVSIFALATEEELNDLKHSIQEMKESKTIEQFIKEHDRTLEMGSLTVLACVSL